MTLLILKNFHVFEKVGTKRLADGTDVDVERRVEFKTGMTVQAADVPAGHNAEDWIAKELARDASPTKAAPAKAPVPKADAA